MMKEAVYAIGALVGLIIALTLVSGGNLQMGTSPSGPNFSLGYRGPQNR